MRALGSRSAIAVLTVGVVVAGACLTTLFVGGARPSSLDTDEPVLGEVEVTTRSFADERTVTVVVDVGERRTVDSPTAGRITATSCGPGYSLESGAVPISVDGTPLLSLATAVPFWRDLPLGAKGPDVLSLQQELGRLGFPVAVDGVLDRASLRAVESLRTGVATRTSEIEASTILWLPAPANPVIGCTLPLGATVEVGDEVFELVPDAGAASVETLPPDLLAGERELIVGEVVVPVDAVGRVGDLDGVEVLANAASSDAEEPQSAHRTVTAVLRLRQAMTVGLVPPSALYDLTGDSACIVSNGRPLRVVPVSSQLGQTFIATSDAHLPTTVEIAPRLRPSCG